MSKKIMLACAAGLSTSYMVSHMQEVAKEMNLDYEIWAEPVSMAITHISDANIVLLGPQVRYELKRFEQAVANKIPVIVIEPKIYGTMNAKALIEQIKGLIV